MEAVELYKAKAAGVRGPCPSGPPREAVDAAVPMTRLASELPEDFFDGRPGASSDTCEKGRTSTKRVNAKESPETSTPNSKQTPPTAGTLPEGFFDDSHADSRARGIEPVKISFQDDYEQFRKSINADVKEVDVRLEAHESVEAIFGQAQVELERTSSSSSSSVYGEFLPFIFSMAPKDAHHLRLCVSDFHSQTWQSDYSVAQLDELRDEVGIDGSLHDFLTYLRAALSSENVKLMLGGLADADGGGATAGRLVAQKTRGTPLLSLPLRKLGGSDADDAKGSIALGSFRAFLALSSALASEKAQVAGLKTVLAAEKAKTEMLKEKITASSLSFKSRSQLNRTISPLSVSVSEPSCLPSTKLDTEVALPAVVSRTSKNDKEVTLPKATGNNRRVHVAPTSRKVKRRGTVIREQTDG